MSDYLPRTDEDCLTQDPMYHDASFNPEARAWDIPSSDDEEFASAASSLEQASQDFYDDLGPTQPLELATGPTAPLGYFDSDDDDDALVSAVSSIEQDSQEYFDDLGATQVLVPKPEPVAPEEVLLPLEEFPGLREGSFMTFANKPPRPLPPVLVWAPAPVVVVPGSNKSYLSPETFRLASPATPGIPATTVVLSAPMGSGKTTAVGSFLKDLVEESVLVVVPTIALAQSISRMYGFCLYSHKPVDEWNPSQTKRLVVCVPSLYKVVGQYDVTIVDEAVSCLGMAMSPIIGDHAALLDQLHQRVFPPVGSTRRVFFIDAMFTQSCLQWIRDSTKNPLALLAASYETPAAQLPYQQLYFYPTFNDVLRGLLEAMDAGRRCVVTTNCAGMWRDILDLLRHNNEALRCSVGYDGDMSSHNIRLFTANEADACRKLLEEGPPPEDPYNSTYVFTPVLGAGASIDSWPVDYVFVVANSKTGTPETVAQSTARFRWIKSKRVYVHIIPCGDPSTVPFEDFMAMAKLNRSHDVRRYFSQLFRPPPVTPSAGILPFLDADALNQQRTDTVLADFVKSIERYESLFRNEWESKRKVFNLTEALFRNSPHIRVVSIQPADNKKPTRIKKRTLSKFLTNNYKDMVAAGKQVQDCEGTKGHQPLSNQAIQSHVFGSRSQAIPQSVDVTAAVLEQIAGLPFDTYPRAADISIVDDLLRALTTSAHLTRSMAPINPSAPVSFYTKLFSILGWGQTCAGIRLSATPFEFNELVMFGQWEALYELLAGPLGKHAREWAQLTSSSAVGTTILPTFGAGSKTPPGKQQQAMRLLIRGLLAHIGIVLEEASSVRFKDGALASKAAPYGPSTVNCSSRLRVYTWSNKSSHQNWVELVSRELHTRILNLKSRCPGYVLYGATPDGGGDLHNDTEARCKGFKALLSSWDTVMNRPCSFVNAPTVLPPVQVWIAPLAALEDLTQ